MNTVHQKLQLQHRRHTGKLLHHRHTSYRGLAVVVGLASVFIVGLSILSHAAADTLTVYARNPAPIPATAAVITYPTEGSNLTATTLLVSGTCPVVDPSVIITITNNDVVAGSGACDANNNFAVHINVTPGSHMLVAKSYTVTDDAGPDSDPIHITVRAPVSAPPKQPTPVPTGTGSQISSVSSLMISPDRPYIVYGPARDALWTGTISGGTAPYRVHINWGDGSSNTYTVNSKSQSFRHHYRSMQSYDVLLHVSDAAGNQASLHEAAVTPYKPPVASFISTTPRGGPSLFGLYGAYLLLLAVFGYLWMRAHPFAYAKVPVQRRANGTKAQYAAAKRRRYTGSTRR